MTNTKILHNPRCSKSRETLALLEAQGLQPQIINYLKTPPSAAEIDTMLDKLGMEPRELMRKNEAAYAQLGLDNPELTRAQLIEAMVTQPILIQRPIVLANGKAAIGRPPEAVLAIVGNGTAD